MTPSALPSRADLVGDLTDRSPDRQGRHPRYTDRAQSETIGVILLTAVIVLLVGGFGIVYLGAAGSGSNTGPIVDASVNATADRISITHAGGESVAIGDLEVVVRSDDANERYAIDAANVTGDGDARFEPGERFSRSHGVGGGQLEVLLIDTGANAVLEHAYLDAN